MGNAPDAEHTITIDLVQALLAEQAPSLAQLPLSPWAGGWDNEMFRLGDSLLVRLPRRAAGAPLMEHEIAWVPFIAGQVSVDTPVPIFVGRPGQGYPWPWSVVPWLPGRRAAEIEASGRDGLAEPLADVLHDLHTTAPPLAPQNPFRDGSLNTPEANARFRARLRGISDGVDQDAVAARWEAWRTTPDWDGPDLWVHGDLHPLNLIVDDAGGLSGVIDWGDLTGGDPAVDLATSWLTFTPSGREAFVARANTSGAYDADTWARARAWALHLAVLFVTMSDDRPLMQAIGRHALEQLLAEPS